VDREAPMFGGGRAPRGSGGALDGWSLVLVAALLCFAAGNALHKPERVDADTDAPAPGRGGQ